MSKLKEFFCYDNHLLGKVSEAIVKAVVSAEMTAYTEDGTPYKTYCWCCALWRGVLLGGIAGLVVGYVIGG